MKKIILFATLSLFISCKKKLDSKVEKSVANISTQTCILPDWVSQSSEYIELMKVAKNEDLAYLTDNENPNVRYYAFIGLLDRNYPKIKDVYDLHKNDSTTVYTSNGACMRNWIPVNILMKDAISSESIYTLLFKKNKYHK